ncbi:ASCH domain-containing protein [Halomarina ordinaria]|uniref:ASCH domain-containing protein n=1 Tax=Halomarina ordinaria TaxID=3033939 RepID=A0ABD5UCJ6_9EURY|nr:ASCH domain-containing protein [Halomarina sp. PSRA2]
MTERDAADLLPNDRVRQLALDGDVTQIHRGNQYAEPGDTFEVEGTTFEVTAVDHRTLGDLTDEDARAEGSADLAAYRERMERVHHGGFEWDDEAAVVRHRFQAQS